MEVSQTVQAMHVASAFSCIEIVDAVYNELMEEGDTFIMSKGHGCMAQYAVLEERGIIDLNQYCRGPLGCHPDYGTPGIEASTGSLGHGLGIALGMAYADPGHVVYCVLSDGELMEGSTWEVAILAQRLSISNLVVLVDYNGWQSLARMPEGFDPASKFRDFGWDSYDLPLGHDTEEIIRWVSWRSGVRPMVAICRTVKGKGVSYMQDAPIWHYRSPSKEEYEKALEEIG